MVLLELRFERGLDCQIEIVELVNQSGGALGGPTVNERSELSARRSHRFCPHVEAGSG